LAYLELDRLTGATDTPSESFCTACLSGHYPVPIPQSDSKHVLEDPPGPDADATLPVGKLGTRP